MKPNFGYSQMRAVRHFQFLHIWKRQYSHPAEKPTWRRCKFVVIYMRYFNLSRLEFIASEKKCMNRALRLPRALQNHCYGMGSVFFQITMLLPDCCVSRKGLPFRKTMRFRRTRGKQSRTGKAVVASSFFCCGLAAGDMTWIFRVFSVIPVSNHKKTPAVMRHENG